MTITHETLATIRVLWRRPDSMTLWGIPYEMREGQSPRDLWESTRIADTCASAAGYLGRTISTPGPRAGWIYLGEPGWYGSLSSEEQAAIAAWLAPIRTAGNVPDGPAEWSTL